jgi:hypothetical protein
MFGIVKSIRLMSLEAQAGVQHLEVLQAHERQFGSTL